MFILIMSKKLIEYKALTDFIEKNNCFEIHNNTLFCKSCEERKNTIQTME